MALLKGVCCWGGPGFESPSRFPVTSLSFELVVWNVSSQLPVRLSCLLDAMLPLMDSTPLETEAPINSSFSKWNHPWYLITASGK